MAAFVKSVNAKIRANPMLNYVCSTRTFQSQWLPPLPARVHTVRTWLRALQGRIKAADGAKANEDADFWGPVSNFGIPIAAVMDTQKSPEL